MAEVEQAENLSSDENESGELQELAVEEQPLEKVEGEVTETEQELEEFEIVLGSADEPSAEEKAPKKPRGVKKLLVERRGNIDRIAELERENDALRNGAPQTNTQANAMDVSIAPTLESCGYDDAVFAQQTAQYNQSVTQATFRNLLDERENGTRRAKEESQRTSVLEAHYDRADKLKVPNYYAAEDKLIEILGEEAVKQIAQVVTGNSELVVNYLGTNTDKAYDLREKWEQGGASAALFELGGLSKDLKVRPKQRKQRPSPESTVRGAAPASKSSLERDIDKERERIINGETNDMTHLNRLKGQLRSTA
jgi:hypothetical protein